MVMTVQTLQTLQADDTMERMPPLDDVDVPGTPEEKVAKLVDFFSTRLLLKRYRREHRKEGVPQSVVACEDEFTQLAVRAVQQTEALALLDAMEWLEACARFSEKWMEVCHWISPKKFREFLADTIGASWARVDEVPPHRELPPVDLKWYKYPEGTDAVQPCICPACRIVCNSLLQYKAHAQGKVHKRKVKFYLRKHGGKAVEPQPYTYPIAADPARLAGAPVLVPPMETSITSMPISFTPVTRKPEPPRRPEVMLLDNIIENPMRANATPTPLSTTLSGMPFPAPHIAALTPTLEPLDLLSTPSTLMDLSKVSSTSTLGTYSTALSPTACDIEMPATPEENAVFRKIMAAWNS